MKICHNLISILDLSKDELSSIFEIANYEDNIFKIYKNVLSGRVLGSLFFQPSTRTQFSSQSAFVYLGGQYIGCNDINQTRSGPPYYEAIDELGAIISNYCDLIIMRTIDATQTDLLIKGSNIPIISAGSGNVEHPTQALTDLFTLKKFFNDLNNHEILIVGTPRQRTINSFINAMSRWKNNKYHIICQQGIEIDNSIIDPKINKYIKYYSSWQDFFDAQVGNNISIVYIDKIFYETHKNSNYVIKEKEFKSHINSEAIILHPLPRTAELSRFMDYLPNAQYFNQAKYGLYTRASLYLHYLHNI